MPATGPALTFDPRYVDFVIRAWQKHDLAPIEMDKLKASAHETAEDILTEFNVMGLHEEKVSDANINKSVALLISLQFAKDALAGPKGAKVKKFAPTPLGRQVLAEQIPLGGVRIPVVRQLVAQSSTLGRLLSLLELNGPIELPALHPTPMAPKKKEVVQRAAEKGIELFWTKLHRDPSQTKPSSTNVVKKPTPAQLVKEAADLALRCHPAGSIPSLLSIIPIAESMGLLWSDVQQLNDVIAVQTVGSAAIKSDGAYVPNAPAWEEIGPRFIQELVRIGDALADNSGFMMIEELRGALGRSLHLSPPIADALICTARDITDRQAGDVRLHFEENEETLYARGRRPLVWRGQAYDFIAVIPNATRTNAYRTRASVAD